MDKGRIAFLDIAKGIGIITVVWAHAKGPGSSYIYQFHMPFFFLVSGYLYNPSRTFGKFAKRKAESLYLPFVFWNLMALCLKTAAGIAHMDLRAFLKTAAAMALALEKDGQFFGATWFLSALFWESILYKGLDCLGKKWKYRRAFITVVFLLGAVVGFCVDFPYMLSRNLILGGFFAIGYWIRENQDRLKAFWRWEPAVIFFVLFVMIGHNGHANMGKNDYSSPLGFVAGALMASYAILYFSGQLSRCRLHAAEKARQLLCFLGERSIDIVIWQFVAFRIVIALQLWIGHKPVTLSEILKYYPVYATGHGWWVSYTLAGIFGSILWGDFLKKGKEAVFQCLGRHRAEGEKR